MAALLFVLLGILVVRCVGLGLELLVMGSGGAVELPMEVWVVVSVALGVMQVRALRLVGLLRAVVAPLALVAPFLVLAFLALVVMVKPVGSLVVVVLLFLLWA